MLAVPLPTGWGEAWIEAPPLGPPRASTVRSYTADGWRLSWRPPSGEGAACDVERSGPVPPALASRWGGGPAFWHGWTAAEAQAKAAGVPILAWLARHGLPQAQGPDHVAWSEVDGMVCAFARPGLSTAHPKANCMGRA
jgi:hypothetical protein